MITVFARYMAKGKKCVKVDFAGKNRLLHARTGYFVCRFPELHEKRPNVHQIYWNFTKVTVCY